METTQFEFDTPNRVVVASLAAKNRQGQIVLLVDGHTMKKTIDRIRENLIDLLKSADFLIPFAMFVDLEDIHIFKWDGTNLSEPICVFKTEGILSHYDPQFGSQRIFHTYLTRLVEAWLRDLAYHWKTETPPASEQMATIGLLLLLKDGTTETEVFLSRNLEE